MIYCSNCGEKMVESIENASVQNSYVAALRKAGSSRFMLVSAILFSASIFVQFISSLLINISDFGVDYSGVNQSAYHLNSFISSFSIMSLFMPAIAVLGMWLFFKTSKDKTTSRVSTSGLTIIKVISIINIVFNAIGAFFVEFAFVLLPVFFVRTGNTSSYFLSGNEDLAKNIYVVVIIVYMITAAVAFAAKIIHDVLIIKMVNAVKSITITEQPTNKFSMTLAMFNFIFAGFSVILGLFLLVMSVVLPVLAVVAIASFLSAAALIVISIGIIKIRPILAGITNGGAEIIG